MKKLILTIILFASSAYALTDQQRKEIQAYQQKVSKLNQAETEEEKQRLDRLSYELEAKMVKLRQEGKAVPSVLNETLETISMKKLSI